MALDLAATKYRVAVMDGDGGQYNIKNYVTSLGWEENENEIATRITFSARNDKTSKGRLSSLVRPGCLIGIFASIGGRDEEVARGKVAVWNPQKQNGSESIRCTAYDALYDLQKSQDNRYYPSGTRTKAVVKDVLGDYGIPMKQYGGPNVSHGKLKYSGTYASDIVLDVLDDAHKRGSAKYVVRTDMGYAEVVERGSNGTVYVFRAGITKSVSTSISIAELVTRVRVLGHADDDGKSAVEATLNGLTKYGIRQKIYTRGSDETLEDAKAAAQGMLDEYGSVRREATLQAPDVPFIRKGDLVYVTAGMKDDYYFVKGIQHDCEACTMTMDLEKATAEESGAKAAAAREGRKVGDIVDFRGGRHYVSPNSGSKGFPARAGKARIAKKGGSGKAHPWRLVHADSGSDVNGWVDDGTFD